MLGAEERRAYAAEYGVPEAQVVRDHLISHVLFALSGAQDAQPVFIGGTALCRTWCPGARLSEDVDLLVEDSHHAALELAGLVSRKIRREFPRATWTEPSTRAGVTSRTLRDGSGAVVRVQFVGQRREFASLPATATEVALRYGDLPHSASLVVPTPDSFVAMKCLAWQDRRAPRDLYDLGELARRGFVTPAALRAAQGVSGVLPSLATFGGKLPSSVLRSWEADLRHQVRSLPDPEDCWRDVLKALELAQAKE